MLLAARKLSARQAAEIGLVDGVWPPERFAGGVEQFVADRLEGRPLRRPNAGLLGHFRQQTKLGRWTILRAARRRLERNGRRYPALPAILGAVEQGHPSWPRRRLDARTADVSRTAHRAPSAVRAWNGSFDVRTPAQSSRGSRG